MKAPSGESSKHMSLYLLIPSERWRVVNLELGVELSPCQLVRSRENLYVCKRVGKKCQIRETICLDQLCKRGSGGCGQRVCSFKTRRRLFLLARKKVNYHLVELKDRPCGEQGTRWELLCEWHSPSQSAGVCVGGEAPIL